VAELNLPESAVLEVYLAEYQKIWDEVYSRFDSQRQTFNYLIAMLGAVAALFSSEKFNPGPEWFFWLPLVAAPLGFIFFDNELMIWAIVRHTRDHLQPRIASLVQNDGVLLLERRRFIPRSQAQKCHRLLSFGRWALFILPILFSMVYATWNTQNWWRTFYTFVFGFDCVVTVILIWGMWQAGCEQGALWPWLNKQRPMSPPASSSS
jgi:hypothetical protein